MKKKRMGAHRMRKVEGTDAALVEHKKIMAQSPAAIGVIKMSIQLLKRLSVYSEARGAK